MEVSPHDMLDKYLEVYGEGKEPLDVLFPVAETEIGNLGTLICMDGHFPESSRALAINGAEIILRPTAMPSFNVCAPMELWKNENKVRAAENRCYVIAPTIGHYRSEESPSMKWPGGSMIFNPEGMLLSECNYPGESWCRGVIDVERLRQQRSDYSYNHLLLLRNDIWREMYKHDVYQANRYASKSPPADRTNIKDRAPLG